MPLCVRVRVFVSGLWVVTQAIQLRDADADRRTGTVAILATATQEATQAQSGTITCGWEGCMRANTRADTGTRTARTVDEDGYRRRAA